MGRHNKPPPPSVGYGARFAVAQGHLKGARIGSLKSPCRTCYWSLVETIALNCLIFGDRQTNKQTEGYRHRVKPPLALRAAVA